MSGKSDSEDSSSALRKSNPLFAVIPTYMFFTFENIIENPSTSKVSSSIIAILIFLFIVLEVL